MTIQLIAIENPEHERLMQLIGELGRATGSTDAMIENMVMQVINASPLPRYILEADTPEELQSALEKVSKP